MTRQQQCHMHAVLTEISRARGVTKLAAKAYLLAKFRAECADDAGLSAMLSGIDSTRQFPNQLASAFVDYLYSWQANAVKKQARANG